MLFTSLGLVGNNCLFELELKLRLPNAIGCVRGSKIELRTAIHGHAQHAGIEILNVIYPQAFCLDLIGVDTGIHGIAEDEQQIVHIVGAAAGRQ